MSLDQSIRHGKDRRKPYHGAKAHDKSCRNHGNCDWCRNGREHRTKRQSPAEDKPED